ncbi:MAG: hypothetical protein KF909_03235 [Rhodocyclaceae bacterium]|nr:hypothetical protein [Rhodocyclaceae bacterium]MCP5241052.1 hypothetical protein [Zoogloeaceae bacterium]MCB1911012.1 hypothetical protein [Rhodocyclaceae bacterium]MCP5255677.1 hypothetical protein [Zoogloeaceae bacterium]MCP5294630.1 hypothetical protein [Zoogloeaceae bacterium]
MLVSLRYDPAHLLLPALQSVAVGAALHFDSRLGTGFALVVLLGSGLFGWLRSVRHGRIILDTPTARIASAAQGYTELRGEGRPLGGAPLPSPVNGLPVLWYRIQREERKGDKWVVTHTYESESSFLLDDGSGHCAVDPEGAEMLVTRKDVFRNAPDQRTTQWALIKHDPIYAIGEFATIGSISAATDTARQVRELLADWKRDRSRLLERFDLDGNGEIDLREWELARAQARREVTRAQQTATRHPEAHVMRKPADGRLYLISDLDPDRIAMRYRYWSWFHLAVFLGAAAAAAWFSGLGAL